LFVDVGTVIMRLLMPVIDVTLITALLMLLLVMPFGDVDIAGNLFDYVVDYVDDDVVVFVDADCYCYLLVTVDDC
jgi:predicted glycosyltransferase involved in capsule biosynthesis